MYSIAVVGHPSRRNSAEELALELGARLYLDIEGIGEWANHARAWRDVAASGASWGVVVQDDALPIAGFLGALESVLQRAPYRTCIGLYVGAGCPRHIQPALGQIHRAGAPAAGWLEGETLHWGVGVALPAEDIDGALAVPTERPYDQRIGEYFRSAGRRVLYPTPSPLDHEDGPSLVATLPKPPRRAWAVGEPNKSDRVMRF